MEFPREMLKDQLHCLKIQEKTFETMIQAPYRKICFFSFNCYNLAICEVTLTEIFSTPYWHNKVQDLRVGSRKTSFHFYHWPTCQ
jgi:hypothetical protein